MKKNFLSLSLFSLVLLLGSCATKSAWVLDFKDDFDGKELNPAVWGRTERGTADWANTQSSDPRCMEFRDGCLVLRGIKNDNFSADPAPYLTGGIWTKDKKAFSPGRFEVRARLQAATGAWPAIWLLPFDHEKYRWPTGGELDIMERLNHDDFAYQTVHTWYTKNVDEDNPPHYATGKINVNDFNTYGVDILPDSVVFHINGEKTFAYPRTGAENQFPFMIDQYLLIDMQLGGAWVGEVDPKEVPVEMEIDWVKHYRRRK